MLQKYPIKTGKTRMLKVGDICLIDDEKLINLGRYCLGIITKLSISNLDKKSRSATINIPESAYSKERYITLDVRLLARIECDEQDNFSI